MFLKRFFVLALAGFLTAVNVGAQEPLAPLLTSTDTLPVDTANLVGVLPNGLTYFIRSNSKPAKRAEFRLVVKAGSLMEDDDQRGLAHWAEHMAFNGTKNFAKNDLIHYLQSIGVKFGADLNAYTSFDRTVYKLPVPTDSIGYVKTALQILEDWAHQVTFDSADFEEERGVILSEMRSRLGVENRMSDHQLPLLFAGSLYADRLPIGTKESLDNATLDQIIRFYKTWYRPDLMAVIAVGDFDKFEMEQMIKDQFSRIPAATTPTPEPKFPLPPTEGTLISTFDDPEITGTSISVIFKRDAPEAGTYRSQKPGLARNIFASLLSQRLTELSRKPEATFLEAGVRFSSLTPDVAIVNIGVAVPNNGIEQGFQQVMEEIARAAQTGFTQVELDRAKLSFNASIDRFYLSRNDWTSEQFTEGLLNQFITGIPVSSTEDQVAIMREVVPTITLEDIDNEANFWTATDNRLIFITMPRKADVARPDTSRILAIFNDVASQTYTAYEEASDTLPLIENLPPAGKVVSEKKYEKYDITEWTLSNGIKVLVKPTTLKANEILFGGFSRGGTSLIDDEDFPTAAFIGQVVGVGGLGRFTPTELGRRLTGKSVNVSLSVASNSQSMSGGTVRKDLETAFELMYLQFMQPRFDSQAVEVQLSKLKRSLENRELSPVQAFRDTISVTLTQGHKRNVIATPEMIDSIDRKRAFELYKERIADPGAFTFMFVGDFDPDTLKIYAEKYLAVLPSLDRGEKARDNGVRRPDGVVRKVVYGGTEPKTTTLISFHGDYKATATSGIEMGYMASVLQNRLTEKLREEMSGTYGVSVRSGRSINPVSQYSVDISFDADPERRLELITAAFEVIDSLKRFPPTAEELKEVIEPALVARRNSRENNQFWLGALGLRESNRDFGVLFDDSRLKDVTVGQIQRAAIEYLKYDNFVQFDLLPYPQSANGTSSSDAAK